MVEKRANRKCNRLYRSSRCKKKQDNEFCSGNDDYCPSRDGLRGEKDFVGEFHFIPKSSAPIRQPNADAA
ncbi:MAG: hypothetical protein WCX17_02320 [Parcubacteria group bacterium]|jgi:hypothetical protein